MTQAVQGPERGAFLKWLAENDLRLDTFNEPTECMFEAFKHGLALAKGAGTDSQQGVGDAIARSKRILALVDDYHEKPTTDTRTALRCALMDEFAAPASQQGVCPAPVSQPVDAQAPAVRQQDVKNPHPDYLREYWQLGFDGKSMTSCTGDKPLIAYQEGRKARAALLVDAQAAARDAVCAALQEAIDLRIALWKNGCDCEREHTCNPMQDSFVSKWSKALAAVKEQPGESR